MIGDAMQFGRTTLSKFVIEHTRASHGELGALLIDVAAAVKTISAMVAKGALGGSLGALDSTNVQGEVQKKLDVLTNEAILRHCEWGGQLAGMASEEMDDPYPIPAEYPRGRYLLVFDPLDGSSNSDVNVSVGTIFSIFTRPTAGDAEPGDYLRPGSEQVAAGYAIYGPSTMMVLTLGNGTHGFTLDRESGNFILTHATIRVPEDTRAFAINMNFSSGEMLDYIDKIKGHLRTPNLSDEQKQEVMDFLRDLYTTGKLKRQVNFRLVQQAFDLRLASNWKRLVSML